jgi:hypothetical protein
MGAPDPSRCQQANSPPTGGTLLGSSPTTLCHVLQLVGHNQQMRQLQYIMWL